jgi:Endosomal/lysosomal potassium channel TMEM175
MSTDPAPTPSGEDLPGVERLLALSDGVVAIAITLLVLQLSVPLPAISIDVLARMSGTETATSMTARPRRTASDARRRVPPPRGMSTKERSRSAPLCERPGDGRVSCSGAATAVSDARGGPLSSG